MAAEVRVAASRQGGLAPLVANLEQALATSTRPLPQPVRAAAEQVLALRLPIERPITADDVKRAFSKSGLFLEQSFSRSAPPQSTPADLKASLIVLRQALQSILSAPLIPQLPSEGTPNAPTVPTVFAAEPEIAPSPLPPPFRGAPPTPQAVTAPTLLEATPLREAGEKLLQQTESALARGTLLQASSLPERPSEIMRQDPGSRWLFEAPIVTPKGASVAQFEVSRDPQKTRTDADNPVWRARFTITLEGIGPVHAHIALFGSRTSVTLFAERTDIAAQLEDNADLLSEGLSRAELNAAHIRIHAGPPRSTTANAPKAGHFLDQAS